MDDIRASHVPETNVAVTKVSDSHAYEKDAEKTTADAGGDSACWSHLFCEDCGVELDGGAHSAHCRSERDEGGS